MSYSLIDMLKFMRPDGSDAQKEFCELFIEPVMGEPDSNGNYTLVVGKAPNVAFMAHHDTVHREGGIQTLTLQNQMVVSNADCLGADCTTGVWLILNMIHEKIPGVYVIHAAEEIGCVGSSAIVEYNPLWIDHVDIAISFDRKGYGDIVTHQCGIETCSQDFAWSLSDQLGLGMQPDDTGVYTDSNEYRGVIAECTNISVGYFNQHSSKEYQDVRFAYKLLESLLNVQWDKLVISRKPVMEGHFYGESYTNDMCKMVELCQMYPDLVAEVLQSYGICALDLEEEIFGHVGRVV